MSGIDILPYFWCLALEIYWISNSTRIPNTNLKVLLRHAGLTCSWIACTTDHLTPRIITCCMNPSKYIRKYWMNVQVMLIKGRHSTKPQIELHNSKDESDLTQTSPFLKHEYAATYLKNIRDLSSNLDIKGLKSPLGHHLLTSRQSGAGYLADCVCQTNS